MTLPCQRQDKTLFIQDCTWHVFRQHVCFIVVSSSFVNLRDELLGPCCTHIVWTFRCFRLCQRSWFLRRALSFQWVFLEYSTSSRRCTSSPRCQDIFLMFAQWEAELESLSSLGTRCLRIFTVCQLSIAGLEPSRIISLPSRRGHDGLVQCCGSCFQDCLSVRVAASLLPGVALQSLRLDPCRFCQAQNGRGRQQAQDASRNRCSSNGNW